LLEHLAILVSATAACCLIRTDPLISQRLSAHLPVHPSTCRPTPEGISVTNAPSASPVNSELLQGVNAADDGSVLFLATSQDKGKYRCMHSHCGQKDGYSFSHN
jgi:hypothetical protein